MHIDRLLDHMEAIPGWFARVEGRLLRFSALQALMTCESSNIVEVGSYCGKCTVVLGAVVKEAQRGRVFGIDPPESLVVGVPDVWTGLGKVSIFEQKIGALGLADVVTLIQKKPAEVPWTSPLCFLFIDGFHDAENVASDFHHFFPHLEKGGYVAFHDYGNPQWPDVQSFVDALLADGIVSKVSSELHLIITKKL